MQMASVETNAGTAICAAPSRIAVSVSLPISRLRLMFSISTVASSTRMPTASARPPRVMMLSVSPSALRVRIETRIDSGMETAMISVLRKLPRKMRIISAVRQAAMTASRSTPSMALRTNSDWSASGWMRSSGGSVAAICGRRSRTRRMMSSVEAPPDLRMVSRVARWPSTRTMLVCGGKPSRTWATSCT
jgi:hypothetical protein